MKLTHLGAQYDFSNAHIETVETTTELCFLGGRFKQRIPQIIMPAKSSHHHLTYRGIHYKA
jgi:hypothetical protein